MGESWKTYYSKEPHLRLHEHLLHTRGRRHPFFGCLYPIATRVPAGPVTHKKVGSRAHLTAERLPFDHCSSCAHV